VLNEQNPRSRSAEEDLRARVVCGRGAIPVRVLWARNLMRSTTAGARWVSVMTCATAERKVRRHGDRRFSSRSVDIWKNSSDPWDVVPDVPSASSKSRSRRP
jgi:hypothetical protein